MAGNLCALNVTTCNSWERNVLVGLLGVVAYALGMTLFTNARVRHARRMGELDGEIAAWKKADQQMIEFLQERAVLVVGQMPPRPEKPKEKAPN